MKVYVGMKKGFGRGGFGRNGFSSGEEILKGLRLHLSSVKQNSSYWTPIKDESDEVWKPIVK